MKRPALNILMSALVIAATCFPVIGAAAQGAGERLCEVLSGLPLDTIESGILYDRVPPISQISRFDGAEHSPSVRLGEWRQMYHEIRRASMGTPSWPPLERVLRRAATQIERGVVPLAAMDFSYHRIRVDALDSGRLVRTGNQLTVGAGNPFVNRRVFTVAPLRGYTYQGNEVVFCLSAQDYFTNISIPQDTIEIDFGAGDGFQAVAFGQQCRVHYRTPGFKRIRVRIREERQEGPLGHPAREASCLFEVRALRTPAPHDTLHIEASIPYGGAFGTAEAYVYLADGHTAVTRPVVLIEGFDLDNSMNWDELYELLNREDLL